ncbi:MAG TPA: hypothetical protein DEB06_04530, partial [Phycisphaerales bacterium]|nr:hypothetical protein [Phycisphaerales bacterium]
WARAVASPSDEQRPERAALAALHPGLDAPEIAWRVFAGDSFGGPALRDRDRRDAWSLLQRLDKGGARTVALLSREPAAPDPMIESLRRCAWEFGAVPSTGEQLEWAQRLLATENAALWTRVTGAASRLSPEQRAGLALGHAGALAWADANRSEWLSLSRADIIKAVEAEQRARRKHAREGASGSVGGSDELISRWRDTISWGDALAALVGARVVDDPGVARALFAQAEEDKSDTSTEHGGLIDASGAGFSTRPFAPRASQRLGDRRFVASSDMLDSADASVFHYHFHAQAHANARYAGPSDDDIRYAQRFGRVCIVFTFVNKDRLNADLYTPSGVILDLGEAVRPAKE